MIVVTPATAAHAEAIAALAEEMDRFYGATEIEPRDIRLRQINEAVFRTPPAAFVLLAWHEERPAGFAAYSFLWPAIGLTRSLYLKELYVIEAARRKGIGTRLMRSLCENAVELGCSRVEWTADQDNADAQHFYEKRGLSQNAAKLFYRIEGDDLHRAGG